MAKNICFYNLLIFSKTMEYSLFLSILFEKYFRESKEIFINTYHPIFNASSHERTTYTSFFIFPLMFPYLI